ncbi:hypothetical protein, partial [Cupriavidus basilensis]|uniref:hypothetical protein n=1 Tax=Cupriavidus basilensis TaxID=68895 RepID=UPI0023E82A57
KSVAIIIFSFYFIVCNFSILENVMAGESKNNRALTDVNFDAAYKDCSLFKFSNENDQVLSSNEKEFHNRKETYWTRGVNDMCMASLRAPTLMPMSKGDARQDGEYVTVNIKRRGYLPGHDRCEGRPDYDNCLQNAVFVFFGFNKDDRGRWRMKTYDAENSVGISLEQSMSETIDGVIEREDGITVIGEWKHPYIGDKKDSYYASEPWEDLIVLTIIRRSPFGYVTLGVRDLIVIPVNRTPESLETAVTLINRIIDIVQSVRVVNKN